MGFTLTCRAFAGGWVVPVAGVAQIREDASSQIIGMGLVSVN